MDANCNRITYANQQPDTRPYSHGGAAITYGDSHIDASAYGDDSTNAHTNAGGNVYIYRGAIVARQRAIVASDERRAGA